MPTGYTKRILDEESFELKHFVMHCAKAFLIKMRDSSGEVPEKFVVSDYHKKAREEAKELQDFYFRLDDFGLRGEWEKDNKQIVEDTCNYNIKNLEDLKKYEAMLFKVNRWNPPDSEYTGLKDFMIEQIEGSIKWDIHTSTSKILTYDEWIENKYKSLEKNLMYHARKYEEEVDRVNKMNKWVKVLRDSL